MSWWDEGWGDEEEEEEQEDYSLDTSYDDGGGSNGDDSGWFDNSGWDDPSSDDADGFGDMYSQPKIDAYADQSDTDLGFGGMDIGSLTPPRTTTPRTTTTRRRTTTQSEQAMDQAPLTGGYSVEQPIHVGSQQAQPVASWWEEALGQGSQQAARTEPLARMALPEAAPVEEQWQSQMGDWRYRAPTQQTRDPWGMEAITRPEPRRAPAPVDNRPEGDRFGSMFDEFRQKGLWGDQYGAPVGKGDVRIGGGGSQSAPSYITGIDARGGTYTHGDVTYRSIDNPQVTVPGLSGPAGRSRPGAQAGQTLQPMSGSYSPDKNGKLSLIGDVVRQSGGNDEDARILQAVATTEGGLEGAVGDKAGGGSYGAFQFYAQGQLPQFARWAGVSVEEAKTLANDPVKATQYAYSTYLGNAIKKGRAQGLSGASLATYVQRHGQVSVNPEKTGSNYQQLFGSGQDPFKSQTRTMEYRPGRDTPAPSPNDYRGMPGARDMLDRGDTPGGFQTLPDRGNGFGQPSAGFGRQPAPPQAPATAGPRPTGQGRLEATPDGYVFPVEGYKGKVQLHHGSHQGAADLFATPGTPVRAMRGGTVTMAGTDGIGGNSVIVQGDDGLQYYYAHMDRQPPVKQGQRIDAGTYLGGVGDTGNAKGTGAHLHLGIGKSIISGKGPAGGAGSDFNANQLLTRTLSGGGRAIEVHYPGDGHAHSNTPAMDTTTPAQIGTYVVGPGRLEGAGVSSTHSEPVQGTPLHTVRANVGNRPVTLWDIALGSWEAPGSSVAAPKPAQVNYTPTQINPAPALPAPPPQPARQAPAAASASASTGQGSGLPAWRQQAAADARRRQQDQARAAAGPPVPPGGLRNPDREEDRGPQVDRAALAKENEAMTHYEGALKEWEENVAAGEYINSKDAASHQQAVQYDPTATAPAPIPLPPRPQPPTTPNRDVLVQWHNGRETNRAQAEGRQPRLGRTTAEIDAAAERRLQGANELPSQVAAQANAAVTRADLDRLEEARKAQERKRVADLEYQTSQNTQARQAESRALLEANSPGETPYPTSGAVRSREDYRPRTGETLTAEQMRPWFPDMTDDQIMALPEATHDAVRRELNLEARTAASTDAAAAPVSDEEVIARLGPAYRPNTARAPVVLETERRRMQAERDQQARDAAAASAPQIPQPTGTNNPELQASRRNQHLADIRAESVNAQIGGPVQGASWTLPLIPGIIGEGEQRAFEAFNSGVTDVAASVAGGAMAVGDITGNRALQDWSTQRYIDLNRRNNATPLAAERAEGFDVTSPTQIATEAVRALPTMLTSLGTGVIVGGLARGAGLARTATGVGRTAFGASNVSTFTQEAGGAYGQAVQGGATTGTALSAAVGTGAINTLIENTSIGSVIARLPGGQAVNRSLGNTFSNVLQDEGRKAGVLRTVSDGAGRVNNAFVEGSQEVVQTVVGNTMARMYDEHQDILEGWQQAFVAGGGMGAVMGGGGTSEAARPFQSGYLPNEQATTPPVTQRQSQPTPVQQPTTPVPQGFENIQVTSQDQTYLNIGTAPIVNNVNAEGFVPVNEANVNQNVGNFQQEVLAQLNVPETIANPMATGVTTQDRIIHGVQGMAQAEQTVKTANPDNPNVTLNADQRGVVADTFGLTDDQNAREIVAVAGQHIANNPADTQLVNEAVGDLFQNGTTDTPNVRQFQEAVGRRAAGRRQTTQPQAQPQTTTPRTPFGQRTPQQQQNANRRAQNTAGKLRFMPNPRSERLFVPESGLVAQETAYGSGVVLSPNRSQATGIKGGGRYQEAYIDRDGSGRINSRGLNIADGKTHVGGRMYDQSGERASIMRYVAANSSPETVQKVRDILAKRPKKSQATTVHDMFRAITEAGGADLASTVAHARGIDGIQLPESRKGANDGGVMIFNHALDRVMTNQDPATTSYQGRSDREYVPVNKKRVWMAVPDPNKNGELYNALSQENANLAYAGQTNIQVYDDPSQVPGAGEYTMALPLLVDRVAVKSDRRGGQFIPAEGGHRTALAGARAFPERPNTTKAERDQFQNVWQRNAGRGGNMLPSNRAYEAGIENLDWTAPRRLGTEQHQQMIFQRGEVTPEQREALTSEPYVQELNELANDMFNRLYPAMQQQYSDLLPTEYRGLAWIPGAMAFNRPGSGNTRQVFFNPHLIYQTATRWANFAGVEIGSDAHRRYLSSLMTGLMIHEIAHSRTNMQNLDATQHAGEHTETIEQMLADDATQQVIGDAYNRINPEAYEAIARDSYTLDKSVKRGRKRNGTGQAGTAGASRVGDGLPSVGYGGRGPGTLDGTRQDAAGRTDAESVGTVRDGEGGLSRDAELGRDVDDGGGGFAARTARGNGPAERASGTTQPADRSDDGAGVRFGRIDEKQNRRAGQPRRLDSPGLDITPGQDVQRGANGRVTKTAIEDRPPAPMATGDARAKGWGSKHFWSDSQQAWVKFDSEAEARYMAMLEKFMNDGDPQNPQRGRLQEWRKDRDLAGRDLKVPFVNEQQDRYSGYEPDFYLAWENGDRQIVETKNWMAPLTEDVHRNKEGKKPREAWHIAKKAIAVLSNLRTYSLNGEPVSYHIIPSNDPTFRTPPPSELFTEENGFEARDVKRLARKSSEKWESDYDAKEAAGKMTKASRQTLDELRRTRAFTEAINGMSNIPFEARFDAIADPIEQAVAIHDAIRQRVLESARDDMKTATGRTRIAAANIQAAWEDLTGRSFNSMDELRQVFPQVAQTLSQVAGRYNVGVRGVRMGEVGGAPTANIDLEGDVVAVERMAAEIADQVGDPNAKVFYDDGFGDTLMQEIEFAAMDPVLSDALDTMQARLEDATGADNPTMTVHHGPDGMVNRVTFTSERPNGSGRMAQEDFNAFRASLLNKLNSMPSVRDNMTVAPMRLGNITDFAREGGAANALERRREQLGDAPLGAGFRKQYGRDIPIGPRGGRTPEDPIPVLAPLEEDGDFDADDATDADDAYDGWIGGGDLAAAGSATYTGLGTPAGIGSATRGPAVPGTESDADLFDAGDIGGRGAPVRSVAASQAAYNALAAPQPGMNMAAPGVTIPGFDESKFSRDARIPLRLKALAITSAGGVPTNINDIVADHLGTTPDDVKRRIAPHLSALEMAAVVQTMTDMRGQMNILASALAAKPATAISANEMRDLIQLGVRFNGMYAQLTGSEEAIREGSTMFTTARQQTSKGETIAEHAERLMELARTDTRKGQEFAKKFVLSINDANLMGATSFQIMQGWNRILNPNTQMGDWVHGVMYSAMLGPRTIGPALIGNSFELAWRGMRDTVVTTITDPTNALPILAAEGKGLLYGTWRGIEAAAQVLRYGATREQLTFGDVHTGRLTRNQLGLASKPANALGLFMETFFGRFFTAVDTLTRGMAFSMQLGREAALEAKKRNPRFTGAEIDHLFNNPTPDMLRRSQAVALETAFQGKMGDKGELLARVQNWDTKFGTGRAIFPFLRTVYHGVGRTIDKTPIGLLASFYEAISDAGSLDIRKSQYVQGKSLRQAQRPFGERVFDGVLGTAALGMIMGMAKNGIIELTGEPPDDEDERRLWERNHQRFSIGVPGQWSIQYSNLGPLNLAFAGVAAILDAERRGSKFTDIMTYPRVAQSMAQAFMDMSYFSSLADVMKATEQDTMRTADAENPNKLSMGMQRFLESQLTSRIPFGASLAFAGQYQDQFIRYPRSKEQQDRFWEAVKSRMPMYMPFSKELTGEAIPLRASLKPALDVWGFPRTNPYQGTNVVNPAMVKVPQNDPVDSALAELGTEAMPSKAPKSFQKHEFDEASGEKWEWERRVGQYSYWKVSRLLDTDAWKNADAPTRIEITKAAYTAAKAEAFESMGLKGPEKANAVNKPKYIGLDEHAREEGTSWQDLQKEVDNAISKYNSWQRAVNKGEEVPDLDVHTLDLASMYRGSGMVDPDYRDAKTEQDEATKQRKANVSNLVKGGDIPVFEP